MKKKKLSELTSSFDILDRIGSSEVNLCERNNVFAEYEVEEDGKGQSTLTLCIHGYANTHIAEFWQTKLPGGYTINVTEREENNVFIYTITLHGQQ